VIRDAIVKTVEGKLVTVEAANPVSCGSASCESGSCCSGKPVVFRALNPGSLPVHPGDRVVLEPPNGNALVAFLLFFALPGALAAAVYMVLPFMAPGVHPLVQAVSSVGAFFASVLLPALTGGDRSSRLPTVADVSPVFSLRKL